MESAAPNTMGYFVIENKAIARVTLLAEQENDLEFRKIAHGQLVNLQLERAVCVSRMLVEKHVPSASTNNSNEETLEKGLIFIASLENLRYKAPNASM